MLTDPPTELVLPAARACALIILRGTITVLKYTTHTAVHKYTLK
jgi:hypothetical protein